jgi:DNA polymerase-1
MSKLVLIDGNAILHRAYHAIPRLTAKGGEPINAVYGFVSMLLRIIQDLKPTHIAVAFDRKEPTFRHIEYKAYQAQRPVMHEDLSSQFEKTRKVLDAIGIPTFSLAGYEADDIIGTLASYAAKSKHKRIEEVVIVTGDRDILQLVTDKVKVYLPIKGLSESKLMGINDVKEKMGVEPKLIPDYKALVGDPSDNYPGVTGIGPKTAIDLLNKYPSVKGIYKNLESVPQPIRMKLDSGKESAALSHKLATIVTDVKLDIDFDKLDKWKLDSAKVLNLFAEIGFKTLSKRIKDVGEKIAQEKQMNLL